jgi:hypothetical protein
VHLLFIADSDNARQTVPIDEVVSTQDMAMLPGDQPPTAGAAQGAAWAQPTGARVARAVTIRDVTKPTASLRLKRRRSRILLRWSGRDTGGSELRFFTVQVRKPNGGWRTLLARTKRHSLRRGIGSGTVFRVRAIDGAGNRSRWALRRASL